MPKQPGPCVMDQPRLYNFGAFRLDPDERVLTREGEMVSLAPKVLDTLILLVQHNGRILEKDELIQLLWPNSFVEEGNLSQNVFLLRKILGDDRNGRSFIQTVPRRGYRFVAPVKIIDRPAAPARVTIADYWEQHSPFRSLRVFEPEDSWLFFGRESETEELVRRLGFSSVLVIIGNSGSGKSSLVRAGLIPALRDGRFIHEGRPISNWRVAVFRPSAAPLDYLAEVLPKQLAPGLSLKEEAEFIGECRRKLSLGIDGIRNAVTALASVNADEHSSHILLVADQFEEIFTATTDRRIRGLYIDALLAASRVDSAVPVHLVLVLRADFYAHCLDHEGLSRCLAANAYNVPRMSPDRLREGIEKRLALAGGAAETGLIDALLQDVGSEPGNLALLEHVLGLLWESKNANRILANQAYTDVGRLRGALGQHADQVYHSLADPEQKTLAQKVFLDLVQLGEGAQDTRRRARKSDLYSLGSAEALERVLARLISARLIASGLEGEHTFIEISHEALIREWPALRRWVAENREQLALARRLQQAAEEWDTLAHDPGALLQGARLAQAREWLCGDPKITPILRQFLQMSLKKQSEEEAREIAYQKEMRKQAEARAQAESQLRMQQAAAALQARRSQAHLRSLSCALGVLLIAATMVAWVARRQQLLERSHALTAQSVNLLLRDHGRALDLALKSWLTARTAESRLGVARAFAELLQVLQHGSPVEYTAFSPDGHALLTAGGKQEVRLWNVADGQPLISLNANHELVTDAKFSPDGRYVAAITQDQTAYIWNVKDGSLVNAIRVPKTTTTRFDVSAEGVISFSPDGNAVLVAGWDNVARLWNVRTGHLIATLQGHTGLVVTAAFSKDGRHIVTASVDKTARVWSTQGTLETVLYGHTAPLVTAEFSPDGKQIVSASWDRSARIWNVSNGKCVGILLHNGLVQAALFSPNGQWVITASNDGTARVWNSSTAKLRFTLYHDGPVRAAEFSPDGRRIITASNDHTARVWNSADGRLLEVLEGHGDVVHCAAFSPDGQRIATGSSDNTVRLWSTVTGVTVATLEGTRGPLKYAEWSADGGRIVTVSDQPPRVWSSNGAPMASLKGSSGFFAHFSRDGKQVVSNGEGFTVGLWNSQDGNRMTTFAGHTAMVWNAEFSPDQQRIVTASADHTARVWQRAGGRLLCTLQGHSGAVYYAAFSPDGRKIVTASADHTARLWDPNDGHLIAVLSGHTAPVWRAAFSPDSLKIVTASFDHTARIWSAVDGRLLNILDGHSDIVDKAEFSPDGRYILTASWDHTVRVWNSADGQPVAVLRGHSDKVIDASFSSDGKLILSASADRTARVWSVKNWGLLCKLTHSDQIWSASFSKDNHAILTASLDQTARVWRILSLNDIEATLAN